MKWLTEQSVWWLTHAKADLTLLDARGVKYTMTAFIKAHATKQVIDEWITLGATSPTR
jgi:hypothetical protein